MATTLTSLLAETQAALRNRAKELLESGEVVCVIGWESGRFENQTTPAFITDPAQAERLIYNEHCVNTLAKYTREEKIAGRVAVCVRGCESRAITRMISDNQLKREEVYLLGVPCAGLKKGDALGAPDAPDASGTPDELLAKCKLCTHRQPLVFDEYLGGGDPADPTLGGLVSDPLEPEERFADVTELESLSREERLDFFENVYNNCIRCYACREVCPCCTCRECFVDQLAAGWQGKKNNPEENRFYNLTRVFHVGDRCIECGECERACPMGLPLMLINRKMIKDLNALFASPEAGLAVGVGAVLGTYDVSDPEEFM